MTAAPTHRRVRLAGIVAALAAVALLAAAPAHAAAATSAVCSARFAATVTPGFSMTPSSGTLTTNGQTGSVSCVGRIGGQRVTGPGALGIEYAYAGTCLAHVGSGTAHWTIPTTAGSQDLVGALAVRRVGPVIRAEVRFPRARLGVIAGVVPTEGNCFVTPWRRVAVALVGSLRGP